MRIHAPYHPGSAPCTRSPRRAFRGCRGPVPTPDPGGAGLGAALAWGIFINSELTLMRRWDEDPGTKSWIHGLHCLLGKPMLGWHSCPGPPQIQAAQGGASAGRQWNKEALSQPHTPGWSLCAWAAPEQEDLPRLWLWAEQGLQKYLSWGLCPGSPCPKPEAWTKPRGQTMSC